MTHVAVQERNVPGAAADPRLMREFVPSLKHRIAGLDEFRGIAILLVMLPHGLHILFGNPRFNPGAYIGVNLFFIISGYLICTILKNTRGHPGYFRTFYVRRIFRIWPLFFAVVGIGILFSLQLKFPFWKALPSYLTFTMNFGWGGVIPGTDPMWSLAIEEQFYLALPILVYAVSPKRLPLVIVVICMVSAVGSALALNAIWDGNAIFAYPNFTNTALRIHYIGLGVLLALRPVFAFAVVTTWSAATVLLTHGAGFIESAVALLLIGCIHLTIVKRPLLNNPWLAKIGFLCYGLYLLHWPILRVIEKILLPRLVSTTPAKLGLLVVYLACSFIAAQLSFSFFESPIQKLRTRFEGPRI